MYRKAWIVSVGSSDARTASPNKEMILAMSQDDKTGTIQYEMAVEQQQALERGIK